MDPWNRPPGSGGGWNKPPNQPNIDELLNNLQNNLKGSFRGKSFLPIIIIIIVASWLLSGFYIVEPDELALVKRFGEVVREDIEQGPHWHIPAPFEEAMVENVTTFRREEIGFRTIDAGPPARYRNVKKESLMLTGDENILDVQFTVQYKINNLTNYLIKITDQQNTVRSTAESAMREVIGRKTVDQALTTGKGAIEVEVASILQDTLNKYQAGIFIENVKLQDVHPPDEVKEAFKDVASAKEDRERLINDAYGYSNNIIPKARGEADQMINQANAYAAQVVLLAKGQANRFESILAQYQKAKEVTEERIRIETMETVLPKARKVISDPQLGKNFLPFLPIRDTSIQTSDTKSK